MSDVKLITPEHTASFCNVMEAKAFSKDQEAKFSTVIAIDKEDKFWKKLDKAIEEVAITKWGEVPKKLKIYKKNGDDEEEKYGWEGKFVITASNKSAPGALIKTDQGLVEPISKDDIYSGCKCRVSLRPFAWAYQNTKGVSFSLDNFLKTGEGKKFTSRTTAAEDFADFADSDWED